MTVLLSGSANNAVNWTMVNGTFVTDVAMKRTPVIPGKGGLRRNRRKDTAGGGGMRLFRSHSSVH